MVQVKTKTKYYCKACRVYIIEEDLPPNLNRVHTVCGELTALVSFHNGHEEEDIDEAD